MKKLILILLAISSTSYFVTIAQENKEISKSEKKIFIILLNDGNQHKGEILSDDGREILILSEKIGKVYIEKSKVKEIKEFKEEVAVLYEGELIEESPFTTRYAFTSNALPIKKGVNYAMVNLYGPEVHFAVSDRLSLGVMATWLASPIGFNIKYTIPTKNKNLNFAFGSILASSGYFNNSNGYGGLGWGTITYGNRTNNMSFSAGYGSIGNFSNSSKYRGGALFSLGAIKKIGKKVSFIFDSMLSFTEKRETNTFYPTSIFDVNGNDITVYDPITETKMVQNFAFFLMPGVRFQMSDKKAFQVSMAGVRNVHGNDVTSFPIPMCSWFFKL